MFGSFHYVVVSAYKTRLCGESGGCMQHPRRTGRRSVPAPATILSAIGNALARKVFRETDDAADVSSARTRSLRASTCMLQCRAGASEACARRRGRTVPQCTRSLTGGRRRAGATRRGSGRGGAPRAQSVSMPVGVTCVSTVTRLDSGVKVFERTVVVPRGKLYSRFDLRWLGLS